MTAAEQQRVQTEKKPYEKPQVVYKGLLEAMAAACQTPQAKAAVGAGCDQFQLFS
jgi:hypothetical protein